LEIIHSNICSEKYYSWCETDVTSYFSKQTFFSDSLTSVTWNCNPLLPTWVVTTAIRLRKSERMIATAMLDTLVRRRLFSKRSQNVSHYRDGFREKISYSDLIVSPGEIRPLRRFHIHRFYPSSWWPAGRIYVFGIALWIVDLWRIRHHYVPTFNL